MSTQPNQPAEKKRSASERITDLENGIMSLFQLNNNLVKDVLDVKQALKLINNKVDAMAKATLAGEQPTDEVLNRIMIENNCEELAQKVTNLTDQGLLAPEDQISENSFVVGEELDGEGKVLNPRLQFALQALKSDMQAKLIGAKTGDTVQIQDNLKFHVIQSYKIQQPQAPAPEVAPEPSPEAPVATTTTDTTGSEPTPVQSN